MKPTENWLPVVGYEGLYEVSDQGTVRSLGRLGRNDSRVYGGRTLKAVRQPLGYVKVTLCRDRQKFQVFVHSMVLEAFVSPRPDGQVARHLNDVPDDNRVSNLAWGTQSENINDSVRNGTHRNASKRYCDRLHPLEGANLISRREGKRRCRACTIANNYAHRNGVNLTQELCDTKFAEIQARAERKTA